MTLRPVRPIFLDHHSTTPVDPRVFDAMRPWFLEDFGNPHSADHAYGWRAEEGVEAARRQVAALVGARPAEIIFTSGATESNNLALQGVAATLPQDRRHVVISAFEHPCVAGVAERLERHGFTVTRVVPDAEGLISPDAVGAALRAETGLVSILLAQFEIGTLQPIDAIAERVAASGAVFHTDAAQAAGKVPVSVGRHIDLLSLSAHKFGGPKGIGALYVRRREGLRLEPLFAGGGQQRGIRPGTIPVPLAVGFGEACRIAAAEMAGDALRIAGLRDLLLQLLRAGIGDLAVNGSLDRRLPNNLNVRLPGVAAVDLIHLLKDRVAISAGSACASAVIEPSPTLLRLGLTQDAALSSVRLGLGKATTMVDIGLVAEAITECWGLLVPRMMTG
jgi:cysteine desulfurase